MYVKPLPVGVNPPLDEDRMPVWRVYGGDTAKFATTIRLVDGAAATPLNSELRFILSNNRFEPKSPDQSPIIELAWDDGIVEVDSSVRPGLIRITLPQATLDRLRRGPYRFSMTVTDTDTEETYTAVVGTLLMEYEPTSPLKDIPYKD